MSSSPTDERRKVLIAAATVIGVIAVMTAIFVLNATLFEPDPANRAAAHAAAAASPAIDRPDGGQAPAHPGDRGGWQQLALLGVLVVALGGGAAGIARSSHNARRRAADGRPAVRP